MVRSQYVEATKGIIVPDGADAGFLPAGTIHLFFEGQHVLYSRSVQTPLNRSGYFSYNHAKMAGQQDFFGQLWKEYAWSDSRYLTSDPFVLCMETVTAVRLHQLMRCEYLIMSIVLLGATVFLRRLDDNIPTSSATFVPSISVPGSDIW